MQVEVLKSKIHRVSVTEARLDYIGSIIRGEHVYIVDNNNGERFETYAIPGERGSGVICLNGAAARKVLPGDVIIIMAYGLMPVDEARSFTPSVIFPDTATNRLIR